MEGGDAVSQAEDVVRSFFQGSPEEEERFKYDVIKGLSESVRQLASGMADMQKTQVGMLERLAALEASRFAASIEDIEAKVAALLRDKDRRDGALGMLGTIKSWAPFLAMLFSAAAAVWLYGRSAGIVPPPPVAATRVEATIHPEEQRIDGVVGGKP